MGLKGLICALLCGTACAADQIPSLTVDGERQRAQLHHDINVFVSDAIVLTHADDQTVERWTYRPVCPFVAGLTKEQGEFMLSRISQIARAAGAPLAAEHCRSPNLFIIVTSDPAALLERLHKLPAAFNHEVSGAQIQAFEKPRPVRTWYNAGTVNLDGTMVVEMLDTSSSRARKGAGPAGLAPAFSQMPSLYGSRLNASTVTHDILSVIEVVDRNQMLGLTMGQLADFVAVAGLAQIDIDKDFGNTPTILKLFTASPESRPSGITSWDSALLHALYTCERRNKMAMAQIEDSVFAQLTSTVN